MNDALSKYEQNKNVWHVSGWNYPLKLNENEVDFDVFLESNELLGVVWKIGG